MRRLRLVLAQALRQLAADGEAPLDFTAAPHAADAPPSHRPPTLPLLRESISQVGAADLFVLSWAFMFDMDLYQKSGNVRCLRVFGCLADPVRLRSSSPLHCDHHPARCRAQCLESPSLQHNTALPKSEGVAAERRPRRTFTRHWMRGSSCLLRCQPAAAPATRAPTSWRWRRSQSPRCAHVAAFTLLLSCCCCHVAAFMLLLHDTVDVCRRRRRGALPPPRCIWGVRQPRRRSLTVKSPPAQVAEGLLLIENLLAAVLAVLSRNQPAAKLGDERVRPHLPLLNVEFLHHDPIISWLSLLHRPCHREVHPNAGVQAAAAAAGPADEAPLSLEITSLEIVA